MEDALVHAHLASIGTVSASLNPCFNGRCTRTVKRKRLTTSVQVVLILVLMEDALVLVSIIRYHF